MDHVYFMLAALTILAAPGPTNALFAASGASRGFRDSGRLALAAAGGYLAAIAALKIVLGPVMASQPMTLPVLKVASGVWLLWRAARLWRDEGPDGKGAAGVISARRLLATTLINPKGLIFAFAIFPEIPVSRLLPWFAEFTVLVLIAAFAWTAAGAMIARSAGTLATPCRIRRTAALALVAFAAIFVRSALASAF